MRAFISIVMSFILLVLTAGASLQAKKDTKNLREQLESELKAELEGKVFTNKIVLGSVIKFYDSTTNKTRNDSVVTEVSPVGDILYTRDRWPGFLGIYGSDHVVYINRLPEKHSIGARMQVKKIKMKGDSVVLELSNTYSRIPGWLKFVFGKNYETRYEIEDVMMQISRVLSIDVKRYELERNFKDLKSKLELTTASQQRFQVAQQSYEILAEILRQLEPSGKGRPKYIQYQQEKANLDTLIPTLQSQAQQEHLAEIQEILKKEIEEENQIKQQLQTKPTGPQEMGKYLNMLKRWEEILKHRQQLFQEMISLGVSSSAEETKRLEENFRELDLAQKESAKYQSKLRTQELENEYQPMKQSRLKLYDSYTQVFGSQQEKEAKANLLNHLQRMVENRRSAEQLGSKQAGAEAVKLLEEIRRLQSK